VKEDTTVIIGAGPFGLSAAAYLKAQNLPFLIFGKPMEFWRKMPSTMHLKSTWSSVTISDPAHAYTFDRFCKMHKIVRKGEVPVQAFLKYSQWYQEELVPDIDETYVSLLARDGKNFQVELADGRSVKANRVFVATGLASFAHIPDFASHLPSTLASHSQEHSDFLAFKEKNVVVVGSGQSAFESAALLYEAGAKVELIARGPIIWINRRLYRYTGPAKRLFYPPSDIGPAGISWIVAFPMLFNSLPEKTRIAIDTRCLRPAGAPWIRPRVEGRVTLTPHTSIVNTEERGEEVCLKLSDGTTRQVDHIILATGYQLDVKTLPYLDSSLCEQVQERNGYPFLNKWFESSVPRLYFGGSLSGYDFGPLCRHIVGSGASASQITRHALLSKRGGE
jgi:FAD-dependent urate hydroxylase